MRSLAFSLSLIGTFLVRSGVLTSVHAFASDPTRGVFILMLIWSPPSAVRWRCSPGARRSFEGGAAFEPVSRETTLLLNNVLLAAAAATVFIGTLYPLAARCADRHEDFGRAALFRADLRADLLALLIALCRSGRGWPGARRFRTRVAHTGAGARASRVVAAIAVLAFITPRTLAGAGAFARRGMADRRKRHRSCRPTFARLSRQRASPPRWRMPGLASR